MSNLPEWVVALGVGLSAAFVTAAAEPRQLSGIYPHLAMFNQEAECGTGAVVPWADRLWVITYAPHKPGGSTDRLYEITPDLQQVVRPESVGGTPANRMIHRESGQLLIGPYLIDSDRRVRVIGPDRMFGRLTGNARHLTDPANLVYYATMEEGFYEVNVRTLEVRELYPDANRTPGGHAGDLLPGYHGKGLASGQGRLVYANNGELSPEAMKRPDIASGCLAEWDGKEWQVVRRNQFTEVAGPGGLEGNHDADDPLWSIGWDHRSLILMLLEGGQWHSYRLPKASHSYDGAHGWNTEWPRIRDIGEDDLLMTMHGTFWRFPRGFSREKTGGIAPRSSYLKVVGDFARWGDRVVLGCDDTARNEFLNKRRAKGTIAAPQSQSNLWFVEPGRLDRLGPVLGRGGVWVDEEVPAGAVSEPFLVSGYRYRGLHLAHGGTAPAMITVEVDERGDGRWTTWREIEVPAAGYRWVPVRGRATWLRLSSRAPVTRAVAWLTMRGEDNRTEAVDAIFAGVAGVEDVEVLGGLVRARDKDRRTMSLAAMMGKADGRRDGGYYELNGGLELLRVEDPSTREFTEQNAAIPVGVLTVDDASVLFVDDASRRWRLPKGDAAFDREGLLGPERVDREVATERDLFNAHGTFYELPADNAGGFAKIRPVATHNRRIHDFCSYRGLLILSGISSKAPKDNPHVLWSTDGRAAVWAGALDDVWRLGKPRGRGGPWNSTAIEAGEISDPYLMTGYDRKRLTLRHDARESVTLHVEVDVTGDGLWREYDRWSVAPGETVRHRFPRAYGAYWLRAKADRKCRATVLLDYQ